MEQAERLRELLVMQLGSQVLQMCELQAQLDAVKAELKALKDEKAGVSAS